MKNLLPPSVRAEVATKPSLRSRFCRQLPNWFVLGFVAGIGLFSRDSHRQVFKWLSPFRHRGTPGRSTLCMARHRLEGVPGSKAADQSRAKTDVLKQPIHYGLHRHFTGSGSALIFGGG